MYRAVVSLPGHCAGIAETQKSGQGAARCPSCSQNAHIQKVLAWDKSASRRARGWAGENVARSKGQPRPLPLEDVWSRGGGEA